VNVPEKLAPLHRAVEYLVVSTAECERSFSAMNDISSDTRSSLTYLLLPCIEEITRWCASRRLQLNLVKTRLIWMGMTSRLKKIKDVTLVMNVESDVFRRSQRCQTWRVLLYQEAAYQYAYKFVFLLNSSSEASLPNSLCQDHSQHCLCICYKPS